MVHMRPENPGVLTWQELDKCQSPAEIADMLRSKGIKGSRRSEETCPLATATGWRVRYVSRFSPGWHRCEDLTVAESLFVMAFDMGRDFQDLAEQPESSTGNVAVDEGGNGAAKMP